MRTCRRCQSTLPDDSFPVRKGGTIRSTCRTCESELRAGRQQNRSEASTAQKKTYYKNRERELRSNPVHRSKTILWDSRRSDKKKGLQNDLDIPFIEESIKDGCGYCGNTDLLMTMDRKDNAQGHLKSNVVAACCRCNLIRGQMPFEAWLSIVPSIRNAVDGGLFGDWVPRSWSKKGFKCEGGDD